MCLACVNRPLKKSFEMTGVFFNINTVTALFGTTHFKQFILQLITWKQ